MRFKSAQCPKGHFYNPSIHSTCPICEKDSMGSNGNNFFDFSEVDQNGFSGKINPTAGGYPGATEPATEGMAMDYGATEPVSGGMSGGYPGATEPVTNGFMGNSSSTEFPGNNAQDYGATEPVSGGMSGGYPGATEPVTNGFMGNSSSTEFPGNNVQDYGATEPVFLSNANRGTSGATEPVYKSDAHGFLPVVGWLVSIEGPTKGTDYRIRPNMNFIGSDNSNDIVIKGDNSISHVKAAVLGYDPVDRMFLFGPANGRNFVYVNSKATVTQVELKARDVVQIGKTKLMFIPLCDENFNWV